MKAYIGSKIILAEPMNKCEFDEGKKQPCGDPKHRGYHVQYSNPDGSKYDSWSPKDVFKNAYREVTVGEADIVFNGVEYPINPTHENLVDMIENLHKAATQDSKQKAVDGMMKQFPELEKDYLDSEALKRQKEAGKSIKNIRSFKIGKDGLCVHICDDTCPLYATSQNSPDGCSENHIKSAGYGTESYYGASSKGIEHDGHLKNLISKKDPNLNPPKPVFKTKGVVIPNTRRPK